MPGTAKLTAAVALWAGREQRGGLGVGGRILPTLLGLNHRRHSILSPLLHAVKHEGDEIGRDVGGKIIGLQKSAVERKSRGYTHDQDTQFLGLNCETLPSGLTKQTFQHFLVFSDHRLE